MSRQDNEERFCVRCGELEKDVRRDGSGGCRPMGGYYRYHSYTTNSEIDKWWKKFDARHNKE